MTTCAEQLTITKLRAASSQVKGQTLVLINKLAQQMCCSTADPTKAAQKTEQTFVLFNRLQQGESVESEHA